jgi:hypothetical protein
VAYAMVNGQKHNVRVTADLSTNFSIEVYPEPPPGTIKRSEPFKPWPTPLVIKICADTREDALLCGLETMKKLGRIQEFHLEPNERPAPPKAAAPKPADDEAEAGT